MSKDKEKSSGKRLFGWFGKKQSQQNDESSDQQVEETAKLEEQPAIKEIQPAETQTTPQEAPVSLEQATEKVESEVEPMVETQPITIPETIPETNLESISEPTAEPIAEVIVEVIDEPQAKPGFFSRLRKGLKKTREGLADGLADLFLGNKKIDEDLFEEIETQLLMSDVGVDATQKIITKLTEQVSRKQLTDSTALFQSLQHLLAEMLNPVEQALVIPESTKPFVILMIGVNGVGKTTTIGKLAKRFQTQGKNVMLAAGDTFRAAAVEQLQVWGQRNDVPVIAQHTGADSASVVFDALQAATARGVDVLIADTAGRLQNKAHLMEELAKVKRVMQKIDPLAPHETLLVLDAGTGQNAINQTQQFHQEIGLTGLAVSKLDGTAKGGVLFALAEKFEIPVRYIGVGEAIDDLRTFKAKDFIQALFGQEPE